MFKEKVTKAEFDTTIQELIHKIRRLEAHKADKDSAKSDKRIEEVANDMAELQNSLSCSQPYTGFVDIGRESCSFSYPKVKSDIEIKLELMNIAGGNVEKFKEMLKAVNELT